MGGNLPDIYRAFGVEPREHKMAVLKTASNFQFFQPISSQVIRVDTRGPGQSDVMTLPWKRVPRPIYPRALIERDAAKTPVPFKMCVDDRGRATSHNGLVPILNEPGRMMRCADGRWVDAR